jgi:hypothetical protein
VRQFYSQIRILLAHFCGRNLFLYGFFIYRVTRKRSADNSSQQINAIDHNKVTLDFRKGEWIPILRDTADDSSKKVRMILWRTPSLDFGLDSPAKAGLIPAQRLEDLLANIRVRDALNSKRALYTALEELQATSSGKPWFSGASNQGYTGLYGFGATQVPYFLVPPLCSFSLCYRNWTSTSSLPTGKKCTLVSDR